MTTSRPGLVGTPASTRRPYALGGSAHQPVQQRRHGVGLKTVMRSRRRSGNTFTARAAICVNTRSARQGVLRSSDIRHHQPCIASWHLKTTRARACRFEVPRRNLEPPLRMSELRRTLDALQSRLRRSARLAWLYDSIAFAIACQSLIPPYDGVAAWGGGESGRARRDAASRTDSPPTQAARPSPGKSASRSEANQRRRHTREHRNPADGTKTYSPTSPLRIA